LQDLWNEGSFEEVPDSDDESVTEEGNEEDDDTSLPDSEAPIDGSAPSSSTYPLEGKVREPRDSDFEEEVEEAEAEAGAPAPIAPKRPRNTIGKRLGKKAKTASTLMQSKLTSSVKPTPAKATPSESANDPELDNLVMLSESKDEDLPRIKG
jgi:hypothetical protein